MTDEAFDSTQAAFDALEARAEAAEALVAQLQATIETLSDSAEVEMLTEALEDVKAGRTTPLSEIRGRRGK